MPVAIGRLGSMAAIGILGGTFDPPHHGHLLLAEAVRVQFDLDRLTFMPAGDPYRKADRGVSRAGHRVAMIRLAIQDNPRFHVDDAEIRRDGPTYTVETLEALASGGVRRPLLVLGVDALRDMPNWYEPERVIELAEIVVAAKGASSLEVADAARAAGFASTPPLVDMPHVTVSSTQIRERVAAALPIRYLLPDAVRHYIHDHGLYGPRSLDPTV